MHHAASSKVGAIFPVLEEHVLNLFKSDRNVFVKFTKMTLSKGMALIFYVSGKKVLIGQAKIENVEKLDTDVAWSLYKNRIFLKKEEYDKYVGISPISGKERKMKQITVFTFSNMKKYDSPRLTTLAVTASGRYLSKKEYRDIVND